jgi:hypothetical protein
VNQNSGRRYDDSSPRYFPRIGVSFRWPSLGVRP